jgi:hypothetical protein
LCRRLWTGRINGEQNNCRLSTVRNADMIAVIHQWSRKVVLCIAYFIVLIYLFHWASIILLVLIMIGRAAFIIPISYLSNLTRRDSNERVGFKQQVSNLKVYFKFLDYCITYCNKKVYHKFFTGYSMVVWSNARSCIHCTCL